ncbi:MAG: ABC transporter permease [Bacteroidetes bacterium]|nr:ABC transporter permease [Bacteroidota bacterium]
MLVRRDVVTVYKQTLLGPLWLFIQPLLTSGTQFIIFNQVAGLQTDGLPAFLFYLTGNVFWSYFATCTINTSNIFVGNKDLFGKVYFPRTVVPLSLAVSTLVKLGLQLLLFAFFWVWYWYHGSIHPTPAALLLPVHVLMMALLGLGIGMIASSLSTRYRDVSFLIGFAVQLLMFLTPVIYPLSLAKGLLRKCIEANPMTGIIESIRHGFLGSGAADTHMLIYSYSFCVALFMLALLIFNRTEKAFIDTV